MKIYTKTGDDGTTSLLNGKRVSKHSLRVEAYGTIDELNSIIGIVRSFQVDFAIEKDLKQISNILFVLGSDLATPIDNSPSVNKKFEIERIGTYAVEFLEKAIDNYTAKLPELKNFILPGGSKASAFLHHSRTVCRRAERLIVSLSETEQINESVIVFVNRLSDYLFTAARYNNYQCNISDILWEKQNETL